MQLVFLPLEMIEESRIPGNLPSPSTTLFGVPDPVPTREHRGHFYQLGKALQFREQRPILGLVQGSIAPSFSDFDLSGMTRSDRSQSYCRT